ncbi:hypothetical protein ABFX02_14G131300 [Erythranthe guttata]
MGYYIPQETRSTTYLILPLRKRKTSSTRNFFRTKNLIPTNIAKFIMNKRMGTVRKLFGIENDYTPEEEEAVMREHQWAHEEGVESDED